jgi:hypothetical protein
MDCALARGRSNIGAADLDRKTERRHRAAERLISISVGTAC